jgi:hypothetical protein
MINKFAELRNLYRKAPKVKSKYFIKKILSSYEHQKPTYEHVMNNVMNNYICRKYIMQNNP